MPRNKDFMLQCLKKSRQHASERHNPENIIKQLLKCYHE